jgi:hypothetical protein
MNLSQSHPTATSDAMRESAPAPEALEAAGIEPRNRAERRASQRMGKRKRQDGRQ